VALPLLLPLSLLYSCFALINRLLNNSPYKSKLFVLSVGNTQLGGTGKTPIVLSLIEELIAKGVKPIIISKSYKATLKKPKELAVTDRALEVGDEALMLKRAYPEVKVFSGPSKIKTLKFAETKDLHSLKNIFILDDGAQHHKIKKDFKIHVWDGSRSIFDLFALPLGFSRECWFMSESSDISFINRESHNALSKILKLIFKSRIESLDFEIEEVENRQGRELCKDAILISGVGNFDHLVFKLEDFLSNKKIKLKGKIEGSDHDSFKDIELNPEEFYICTEKDHDKLRDRIKVENLFVIKSRFSKNSLEKLSKVVEKVLQKMEEQ
jgi:tetraacyldisaccharide 4'-kinase